MERTFSLEARAVVPDHAWFDQRDAQRRQHQHQRHQHAQRHRVAHRSEPGRADRSEQEVGATQNQVGQRKRPAEAQAISDGSAEHCQKPDQTSEQSSQAAGLFHSKIQGFVKIARQRCERGIVGKSLKEFADIGDPERALEPGANLLQAFGKSQKRLLVADCRIRSRVSA